MHAHFIFITYCYWIPFELPLLIALIPDKFQSGRSRSEEISRDCFPKTPREIKHGRSFCRESCGSVLVLSNRSLIEKWKNRLWSSFERYNSVLQQALALSPFRRRIMARNRTGSLTRSEGEPSEVNFDRRNVIELDQVIGILRVKYCDIEFLLFKGLSSAATLWFVLHDIQCMLFVFKIE